MAATTSSGRKKKEKIVAALVSDSFNSAMEPITSSIPQLLLPIANTPLIDYQLESLVVNQIDEVVIFAYSGYSELSHHIKTVSTASGKPWSQCKELKVDLVDCTKNRGSIRNLTDLFSDIRSKNKLSGNFILLSPESINNLRNLKEIYQNHVHRLESRREAVLTMIAIPDRGSIDAAHNRVAMSAWEDQHTNSQQQHHQQDMDGSGAGHHHHHHHPRTTVLGIGHSLPTPTTVSTVNNRMNSIGSFDFDKITHGMQEVEQQHVGRFSVALEATHPEGVGNMALHYHEWDQLEEGGFGGLGLAADVMRCKTFSLRTDLLNTGVYICHPDMMDILNAAATEKTMPELLKNISDNREVLDKRFAVVVAPTNTTVGYVNSPRAYLSSNILAIQRHFFPLTRESNFADSQPNYLVARSNPSIFLFERRLAKEATETRISSHEVGPDVVVGLHTVVPNGAAVARTVLGRAVKLGKNVRLFGCIIMNDVLIGDNVEITNSVIGSNVKIASGTTICAGSVIGKDVQVAADVPDVVIAGGTKIVCPATGSKAPTHPACIKGRGVDLKELQNTTTALHHRSEEEPAPLDELFKNDVLRYEDSDAESGNGDLGETMAMGGDDADDGKNEAAFKDGVKNSIEKVLLESVSADTEMSSMKFTMLSYHRVRVDLAAAALEAVFDIIVPKCKEEGIKKSKEVCQKVTGAITTLSPVFVADEIENIGEDAIRSASESNPVLETFAAAVHKYEVLRKKADTILSLLYTDLDEDLFQKQGYCVVSEDSIIKFDKWIKRLWDEAEEEKKGDEEVKLEDLEPEDVPLASGWDSVFDFVEEVREERKARKKAEKKKRAEA